MNNSYKWFLFLFVILLFSACKIDMKTEIYLRDIKDVALSNADDLFTSGLLRVGVPSCEDREQLDQISNLLKDYFLNIKVKKCSGEMQSFVTIGVDIPIVHSETGWIPKTKSVTALVTHKSNDGSSIVVNFALNRQRFNNLNEAVENKFFDKLSFSESTVSFAVNNDGRKDEEAIISDAFVDGRPVIHSKSFTLARRNKIEVEPSNVRRISFSENGSMPVLEIPIGK